MQPQVSQNTTTMQDTHTVTVVTSFFPLAKIATTVGGEYVTVHNLAGGQEVHAYAPSPRDLQQLRSADVAIVLGGVEPWAEELVPQLRAHGQAVTVMRDHVPFDTVASHADAHEEETDTPAAHDHDHAHGHAAADDRHDRCDQSPRRHPVRSRRSSGGIAGHRADCEPQP